MQKNFDGFFQLTKNTQRQLAIEIQEFLIGRNEQLSYTKEAIKRWKTGYNSNVVIFGEMGSGKTSLINCIIKYLLKDEKVYRFKLTYLNIAFDCGAVMISFPGWTTVKVGS